MKYSEVCSALLLSDNMENKLNHKAIKDFLLGKSIVIKKIVESDISQQRLYLPFAMLAYNSHAHTVNAFRTNVCVITSSSTTRVRGHIL